MSRWPPACEACPKSDAAAIASGNAARLFGITTIS